MKELKTIRDILQALLDGHEIENYFEPQNTWEPVGNMCFETHYLDEWVASDKYRIKTTKPSINWEHVSDEFNYLARDECGLFYLYGNKPKINNSLWCSVDHNVISADAFKSLQVGNCHWKDSLVERPRD